jgi:hypothetical protein
MDRTGNEARLERQGPETMNTREIMTAAWTIARDAAKTFGGRPAQYIAEALRQSWAAARQTWSVEGLKAIGNEWQAGDKHRVYFNNLAELFGLDVSYYRTGNVQSARLHGVSISNREARGLLNTLRAARVWYEMTDGKFWSRGLGDETRQAIVSEIKRRATA